MNELNEEVDEMLKEAMMEDYDLVIRMLAVVSSSDSPRNKKEMIRRMLEDAADNKTRVQTP